MMTPKSNPNRRRAVLLGGLGLFLVMVLIAGAATMAGWLGSVLNAPTAYPYYWDPTPGPQLAPPLTPFAPVDAAMVALLAQGRRQGPEILVVPEGVMPVGAYAPPSGSTTFILPTPTPPLALVPLPTLPIIEQAPDAGILPTPTQALSPLGGPAPEPYGGIGCAPRGMPTGGLLTQRFHAYHSGVDYGIPLGTPVRATHSAEVIFAGWSTVGYGNLIILQNGSFITYYAHLTDFNVLTGQQVGVGSIIGWSGSTGNSSGPHIHYEVRIDDVPVDPLAFDSRGYPTC